MYAQRLKNVRLEVVFIKFCIQDVRLGVVFIKVCIPNVRLKIENVRLEVVFIKFYIQNVRLEIENVPLKVVVIQQMYAQRLFLSNFTFKMCAQGLLKGVLRSIFFGKKLGKEILSTKRTYNINKVYIEYQLSVRRISTKCTQNNMIQ